MKTKTIVSPASMEYQDVLRCIESSPDSFTVGRRNNDLVNWVLIHLLIDLEGGCPPGSSALGIRNYTDAFQRLLPSLSKAQRHDLDDWYESSGYKVWWDSKISRLVEYYGRIRTEQQLFNLWLPMEYVTAGAQPENQLELLSTEA